MLSRQAKHPKAKYLDIVILSIAKYLESSDKSMPDILFKDKYKNASANKSLYANNRINTICRE